MQYGGGCFLKVFEFPENSRLCKQFPISKEPTLT